MRERKLYTVAIPLTAEEAQTLLETAARWGQDLGTFLSGIATDMYNGAGDEGYLIEEYLQRAEPVDADKNFVGFCLRYGYEVDYLEDLIGEIDYHTEWAEETRKAIRTGIFPTEDGWKEGTTPEDARQRLADHEEGLQNAIKDKADLWEAYQEAGGTMSEEEALEEARNYLKEEKAWKEERITLQAKEALTL